MTYFRDDGEPYLIVDCGGGTIDLVVHSRSHDGVIREVAPPSGGLNGGSMVDEAFLALVRKRKPDFDAWAKKNVAKHSYNLTHWELTKHTFTGQEKTPIGLDLKPPIRDLFAGSSTDDDDDEDDEASIPPEEMARLFEVSVIPILLLIDEQLRANPQIRTIIPVGGFSQSKFLHLRIKQRYEKSRNVVLINQGASAVVGGSILLGYDHTLLASRCMKKTYGVAFAQPAEPEDPPQDIVAHNGKKYCTTRFSVFVSAGQEVPVNHEVSRKFRPANASSIVTVSLFSSASPNPRYAKAPVCKLLKPLDV